MGYATITGGGADGRYTVELDLGTASRDELVAELAGRIAELTGKIDAEQPRLDAAVAQADGVRRAVGGLIDVLATAMQADPVGDYAELKAEIERGLKDVVRLEGEAARIRAPLEILKADRANLERSRSDYSALMLSRTQQAWCVDLTEDATGEVATIEVPGEPQDVLIGPGGGPWSQAGDGLLLNRALMSPAQAFLNAAILPGWQKWKPTFRKGTVTAVDTEADTADVTLDAAASTARGLGVSGLPVNQAEVLVGVPVEYMSCNAAVFEPGDRCVVQFVGQDWASPKVIGFAEWPKACEFFYLSYQDSLGAWVVSGDNYQDGLRKGQSGTQVCADVRTPNSFNYYVWWRWSDGDLNKCRIDSNVQASKTVQAIAIGFPRKIVVYMRSEILGGGGGFAYGTTSEYYDGLVSVFEVTGSGAPNCDHTQSTIGFDASDNRIVLWREDFFGFSSSMNSGDVVYESSGAVYGDGSYSCDTWYSDDGGAFFSHKVTSASIGIVPCIPIGSSEVGSGSTKITTMPDWMAWGQIGLPDALTMTHLESGKVLSYSRSVGEAGDGGVGTVFRPI